MSKYNPLQTHLRHQEDDRISMSFEEVEAVLGFPLPRSARRHPAWWANNAGTHVNAEAWLSAGWKTSQVDLASERLTFVRETGRPSSQIVIPAAFLTEAATRMLEGAGGDRSRRAADILNAAASARKRSLVDRFTRLSPSLDTDSADMIRQDRDAR